MSTASSSSRHPLTPPLSPTSNGSSLPAPARAHRRCTHKPVSRHRRSSRSTAITELSTRVAAVDIACVPTAPHSARRPFAPPTPPEDFHLDQIKETTPRPKLGKDHSTCTLKCGVKRALMMDSRLCGECVEVPVRIHMSPDLFEPGFAPRAITIEPTLHVHHCPLTDAHFVVAHELVRQFLPTCPEEIGRKLHSIYTLNHPYGRGTPACLGQPEVGESVWRRWLGCPQALQCRRADPGSGRTRVWLVDGRAEVLFGAECEPDESTLAPPLVSSKGKRRAE